MRISRIGSLSSNLKGWKSPVCWWMLGRLSRRKSTKDGKKQGERLRHGMNNVHGERIPLENVVKYPVVSMQVIASAVYLSVARVPAYMSLTSLLHLALKSLPTTHHAIQSQSSSLELLSLP